MLSVHLLDVSHISLSLIIGLAVVVGVLLLLVAVSKVPLSYNVRNLLVRWRVTLLTALAFTLVVSLLTVMLAFVNGMKNLTDASGQPGNVIVLSNGANDEAFSTIPISDTANLERQPGVLRDESGQPMCSREAYIVVNQPVAPSPEEATSSMQYFIQLALAAGVAALGFLLRNLLRWGALLLVGLGLAGVVFVPALLPANPKPQGQIVRGKITSIFPEKADVIVTDQDGKVWNVHVPDDARILINGNPRKLTHLNVDQKVWLIGEQQGGNLEAREVRGSEQRRFVQVRGIDDAVMTGRIHGFTLYEGGKWFSEAGIQDLSTRTSDQKPEQAIQVVLGEGLARLLGSDSGKERLEAGDVFELGPRKWIVTGVMKSAGSTFDSEAWAKRGIVGPIFGKEQLTTVVVRTKDAEGALALAEDLKVNYRPAVSADPETVYYEKLSETNKQFTIAIYFVTIIMAIGGVFGVMNTMFAAIAQRTKDIGVLRILGFARWQVLVSFFLETLVIALVGGLIGCALGSVSDGWTATSIVSSGQGGGKTVVLKLVVDANTLAVGAMFTLIMGSLGGLIPALSAMRLRPLESLR